MSQTVEGRLDRQPLLDVSLDALNLGFAQFRAGWFSRFHESLAWLTSPLTAVVGV